MGAPPVVVSADIIDATCAGSNDSAIDLSLAGDDFYIFYWSNGFTIEDPNGLSPGNTYIVSVTDAYTNAKLQYNFQE